MKAFRDWLGRKSRLGNFDSEAEVARVLKAYSPTFHLATCEMRLRFTHSLPFTEMLVRLNGTCQAVGLWPGIGRGAVTHETMRCLDALHHALMGTSSCLHDDAIRACMNVGFW